MGGPSERWMRHTIIPQAVHGHTITPQAAYGHTITPPAVYGIIRGAPMGDMGTGACGAAGPRTGPLLWHVTCGMWHEVGM